MEVLKDMERPLMGWSRYPMSDTLSRDGQSFAMEVH
jgi:hypothetical protein